MPSPPAAPAHAAAEDIFFSVIALCRTAMLVTDPEQADNPVVYANAAFEALFGYPLASIRGSNPRFMSHGLDPEAARRMRAAIDDATPITLELSNRRADGSDFLNSLCIAPIFDASGQVIYFLGSFQDVTLSDTPGDLHREGERARALLEQSLRRQIGARLAIVQAKALLSQAAQPQASKAEPALRGAIQQACDLLDRALDELPE